jgi:hypothetical protein
MVIWNLLDGGSSHSGSRLRPSKSMQASTLSTNPRQHLHLPLPMEPILFLLLPSKTMLTRESTILPWRNPKKLLMLSLVCFSSMSLLHLCYLIPEHRILSYLLHMLRSIINP